MKPPLLWYEEEDPDIHSGIYFPTTSKVNHSHHYETIPYNGGSHSPSPQPVPPAGNADRKHLEKQRLDYYFSRQEGQEQYHRHSDRRESSPATCGYGTLTQYDSLELGSPNERKFSDSELMQVNIIVLLLIQSFYL